MRLRAAEKASGLRPRLLLGLLGLVTRKDSPLDVLKTIYHKPRSFGTPFLEIVNATLRGPSEWSVGERELFAAFTSKQNECPFCVGSHTAIYTLALGEAANLIKLDDWRNAPVDAKVKAALGLIEKMSRGPRQIGAADVDAVRAAGVSDTAIEDVIHIAFCFHIINRLANAFDFHVASPETFRKVGKSLLKRGYRL
jgi:uncharacterized peroxidase-related enzyme